jgi:hypothetical protein
MALHFSIKLVTITCFFFFSACKTPKDGTPKKTEDYTVQEQEGNNRLRVTGKIVMGGECLVYLEAIESDTRVTMYPVNLDPQFQKNGLKISFFYQPSRAKQPAGCIVDKVVSLEDVQVLKN